MLTIIRKKHIYLKKQLTMYVKKTLAIWAGLIIFFSAMSMATDNPGGIGGINSLRGMSELEETLDAAPLKKVLAQVAKLDNNFVGQPPLIPHAVRNYEISKNANKCLSCHSWKQAARSGAVKISITHYQNREDMILSDVSPRRYFCLQCHVPQVDAKPLIGNDFKPVKSLEN